MTLPTVILPGFFESAAAYSNLEKSLQNLGFPAVTVPLQRRDWIATVGGKSVIPILQQLDCTVKSILQQYGVSQVNLIGHSAGGWISRIYLGEVPYGKGSANLLTWKGHPQVATLVTLGTPHTSLERWTRSNLDFVNNNYPGAFYEKVRYVCVAGKTIFGQRRLGNWLAFSSYKLTCGNGNTWGDGITPIEAAHLSGANNLIIEGVMHSPRSPQIWYGSPESMGNWVKYLS
ncbi:MAG: alpha/beta hydrolase [Richelia sp. RM2_1_2]|nr:alpha/beta hydrolase [Richelia sp. SM1_7_0]NJN10401.1 alpha/beta hydrolase [Richelia sp. RM1_1_1]NJO28922.1 alpha/beta hydrolase [Richelia sp. SL_2_1]NJO60924.1 alpha/beta hydrolase [Richelia sp. RM2_1_2]NJS15833.1 alpha/beta hydrolase [Nostocaceae cyanobacterium CSU_2_110]